MKQPLEALGRPDRASAEPAPPRRRGLAPVRALTLLALAATFGVLAVASFGQPLGFDESYNLQIVGHLLHEHRYATDGLLLFPDDATEFDYRISTGPTLMLPVAAAAALLGEHVWVYRLVPLAFFALLLAGWFRVGRTAGGFWVGAAAAGSVLALDTAAATWGESTYLGPGDVLGEATAAALVVAACTRLRHPRTAGLLLGLAVLTKTVVVLAAPVLGLAVLLLARPHQRVLRAALGFTVAAVAPLLGWQVVRFAAAGRDAAQQANADFVAFLLHGGSGLAGEPTGATLGSKLSGQAELLALPLLVAWAGVVVVALVLGARSGATLRSAKTWERWHPVTVAACCGGVIELWWLVLADHDWVRHSLTAVLLLVPALVCVTVAGLTRRRVAATALAALLAASVVVRVQADLTMAGPRLDDQRRVAERLRDVPEGYLYAGRNQLADLMLLGAGTPRAADEAGGLVVLRHPDVTANPRFERQLAACGPVVFDDGGFVGCVLAPGPVPDELADWLDPDPPTR